MIKSILVINGLVKKGGNTDFLLRQFLNCGDFQIKEIVLRDAKITHCTNCEYCLKHNGKCCFDDDMKVIFDYSNSCDYLAIASPIVFGNTSGYISNAVSRFQSAYRYSNSSSLPKVGKPKKAVIILTGGGSGGKSAMAEKTTRLFAKMLNAKSIEFITSYNTDKIESKDDAAAMDKINIMQKEWINT